MEGAAKNAASALGSTPAGIKSAVNKAASPQVIIEQAFYPINVIIIGILSNLWLVAHDEVVGFAGSYRVAAFVALYSTRLRRSSN